MMLDIRPVTPDRIDDFVRVANPNRRASHCWCLSHRLTAPEIAELGNGSREQAFRALAGRENPPGVIGYDDGSRSAGAASARARRTPAWPVPA